MFNLKIVIHNFKSDFNYLPDWKHLFNFWRKDLMAGITVGIVALPLALGFAITTGAPARAGLVTAIIAGFIAALFGGSNYQVSGPTGAMTVVLVPIVSKYGLSSLAIVGIGAGLLIVLLSLLRVGRFIDSVPWSVMEGFTLGIAVIIALQQIPLIFEVEKAPGSHTLSVAWETTRFAIDSGVNQLSFFLVVLTLMVKFTWPKIRMKIKFGGHIPASIVAVVLLTLVSQLFKLDVNRIGALPKTLEINFIFDFADLPLTGLLYAVVVVALLGAIESLLSARVADGMARKEIDHEQSKHQPNKELLGQGLATMASAFAGGLPATGAIARTSVNVRSGARTRLAAMIHALFLLLVILMLAPLVSQIPTAVLAGVLLGTSLRIANPSSIKEALTTTKSEAITYLVTALAVVAIDLIWGMVIGLLVYRSSKRFSTSK
ncbi:MAG: hypothetical protein RL733_50 [Actinomycetota bacterium]